MDLVQLSTALAATLQSLGGAGGGVGANSGGNNASFYDDGGGGGGGGGGRYDGRNDRSRRKSSSSSSSVLVVMKLAKRGGLPCLCLDASCPNGMDVHHAVPVSILRAEEWQ